MIHKFSFYPIDARMYILVEGKKALVIDPCVSDKALDLLEREHVEEVLVILTHEHMDHITGVEWLRENVSHVTVLCSKACAEGIQNSTKNLSRFWEVLFMDKSEEVQTYIRELNLQPFTCKADEVFEVEKKMTWEGHNLYLRETPGHSPGSICILLDETCLFSGDSLVTGYATITRLPGGKKKDFREITVPYLQSLNGDILVYPGHGEPQKLSEFEIE